ncbi:hypothetical protein [Streptomyces sp. NPDC050485]|uniref:hypothetical protein n=1 Tax=Streptomyces sp. NPDC050485 TaxID=3365617 RepID=UPI0037BB7150
MTAKHRHARTASPAQDADGSGLPLVVLLLLGLASPAWILRDQAAELVTGVVREAIPVTVPNAVTPGT